MARERTIAAVYRRRGKVLPKPQPQTTRPFTAAEETARDAEEAAEAAEAPHRERAALVSQAVELEQRAAAAERLAVDIPEAAAEAQRLQGQITEIKARLAATRPPERS